MDGQFRAAMRRLASSVSIISVQCEGTRHGTTATAVTSLSVQPPALLICIGQGSRLHDYLAREARFCVNLLHTDNLDVSHAFSQPLESHERFAHGDWRTHCDVPYLADAQANLFCEKRLMVPYGTHTVFIGNVDKVLIREEISSLVYLDGRYVSATPIKEPMLGLV